MNSDDFRRGHAKTDGEKPVATHATLLSFEVVEWPERVASEVA